MSGLTAQGYVAETVEEAVADLNAKILANVDAGLDLSPDQPIGQLVAAWAEKFAELSELEATVYNALNPSGAEGQLLVNVCAISGTRPQAATYSKVVATLTTSATVPAGSVVAVLNQPANTWVLTADAVPEAGVVTALFRSSQPGIFRANAGSLTVINTPVIGWTLVTNPGDSVDGLAADTDTTLRQKREAELAGEGNGSTLDDIRAAVLKVPQVIQAFAFQNTSLVTDANGLPGKAFRVVIWDGASPAADDDVIAKTIWTHNPSGILAYGGTSITVTDSAGNPEVISFDRATQRRLYVACTTTPSTLTSDQRAAIKAAIKGWADTYFGLGVGVIARSFSASPLEIVTTADATAIRPAYTPAITDVPAFAFDFAPSPVNTANLAISALQIVTLATTDILVNGL